MYLHAYIGSLHSNHVAQKVQQIFATTLLDSHRESKRILNMFTDKFFFY